MLNRGDKNSDTSFKLTKKQFENFFTKNYHTACLIALRYISDPTQAEDLVQDIFVSIWEKRDTLRIDRSLKSYVFSAVRNQAINVVTRKKDGTISLADLNIDLPEEKNTKPFNDEELAVKIASAIEELPPACRNIFTLAYNQKLTYQQVAQQLDISKNTVKTQMGIAYRQLREKLKNWVIVLLSVVR